MKLKLSHIKWCVGLVVFVVVNVHVTLMFLRSYDKAHHIIDVDYARLAEKYGKGFKSLPTPNNFSEGSQSRRREDSDERAKKLTSISLPAHKVSHRQPIHGGDEMDLSLEKTGLPAFAVDESEFIFSSVIERVPDSWSLYVTTLMLCHYMLQPADIPLSITKVHPYMRDVWRRAVMRFRGTEYYPSGTRIVKEPFYCRISHSGKEKAYVVPGYFLPNRLTSDSNSNRRLDVLRCPMQNSKHAYGQYARSSASAFVEIIRGNVSLVNFTISWATRRSGLLVTSPTAASRLDPWKGFSKGHSASASASAAALLAPPPPPSYGDKLHICVPGTKQLPSKKVIPYFVEFVSHHLLIGADHIYLPLTLSWTSESMAVYLTVLRSYIEEGKLTVVTQSGDGLDMISSVGGLSWHRAAMKIFQANSCLYLAKGLTEYLAVFDVDEFFIPKGPHMSFMDVVKSTRPSVPLAVHPPRTDALALKEEWARKGKGGGRGAGWADKDGHPYCYISVSSEVVPNKRTGGYVDPLHPWMGQRYDHGPESPNERLTRRYAYAKPIHKTDYIHQSSLNAGGACKLPWEWTTCSSSPKPLQAEDQVCGNGSAATPRRMTRGPNGAEVDFRIAHDFDETVIEGDAYGLDPHTQGSLYHFLMYHEDIGASDYALQNTSEYASKHFPAVHADLRSRGLDLLMLLKDTNPQPETVESTWSKLFTNEDIGNVQAFEAGPSAAAPTQTVKLPENFAQRQKQDEVKLPNFASDFSEFLLGAMIERVSDSWDLYLTSFFLCHWLLEPKLGASAVSGERVSPEMEDVWKRAMVAFEVFTFFRSC